MKISHYHISRPIDGLCKQNAIWGREARETSNYPLVYLQRPKWIKDDAAWLKIVDSVKLKLPRGFEVK